MRGGCEGVCGWGEGVRMCVGGEGVKAVCVGSVGGEGGRGSLGEWLHGQMRQCHVINEEGKSTQMNKMSRLISVN